MKCNFRLSQNRLCQRAINQAGSRCWQHKQRGGSLIDKDQIEIKCEGPYDENIICSDNTYRVKCGEDDIIILGTDGIPIGPPLSPFDTIFIDGGPEYQKKFSCQKKPRQIYHDCQIDDTLPRPLSFKCHMPLISVYQKLKKNQAVKLTQAEFTLLEIIPGTKKSMNDLFSEYDFEVSLEQDHYWVTVKNAIEIKPQPLKHLSLINENNLENLLGDKISIYRSFMEQSRIDLRFKADQEMIQLMEKQQKIKSLLNKIEVYYLTELPELDRSIIKGGHTVNIGKFKYQDQFYIYKEGNCAYLINPLDKTRRVLEFLNFINITSSWQLPYIIKILPLMYIYKKNSTTWCFGFLMEIGQGSTLKELIDSKKITKEEMTLVIRQVKELLPELKKYNYVFSDFETDNIMWDSKGQKTTFIDIVPRDLRTKSETERLYEDSYWSIILTLERNKNELS